MSLAKTAMLVLAMVLGELMCYAQNTTVPIRQIERDARNLQLSAKATIPENEAAMALSYGMPSGSSAGFVRMPPASRPPRTLSAGFFLFNGLHLGMAVFDVEMTQHCIANHHCVEKNPMMPSSHAGQLGLNFALVGSGAFVSYKLRKEESKMWMLSPLIGISAHAVGAATGIAHR